MLKILGPMIGSSFSDTGPGLIDSNERIKTQGESSPREADSSSFAKVMQNRAVKPEPSPKVEYSDRSQRVEKKNEATLSRETRPESENSEESAPPGASKEIVRAIASKGGIPVEQRQKALLKFMDSIESEFGIPPEKIVEAMANLTPPDLLKSPESTADQVIGNLNLAPEDQERAMQLYFGVLHQWRQIPLQTTVPGFFNEPAQAMMTQNLTTGNVAISSAERRHKINDSIDRLNHRFFMTQDPNQVSQDLAVPIGTQAEGQMVREGQTDNAAALTTIGAAGGLPHEDRSDLLSPPPTLPSTSLENRVMTSPSEVAPLSEKSEFVATVPMKDANSDSQVAVDNPDSGKIVDTQKVNRESPQIPSMMLSGQGKSLAALAPAGNGPKELNQLQGFKSSLGPEVPTVPTVPTANAFANYSAMSTSDSQSSTDSQDQRSGSETNGNSDQSALGKTAPEFFVKPSNHLGGSGSLGAAAAVTARSPSDPNVQAVMNQAQLIVNRGGGEATVRLNPEGLGEVRLKVMVVNGRVNVEMATQTKEAKLLLEGSLSDLRNSLSSHKLSVDHVKVDVGNQAQSDSQNHSQKSLDFGQDMSRNQAKSFLNNFREDTASRRDPYFEMPGIKAYQKRPEAPAPIGADSARTVSRYASMGRGERMNLVA